MTLIKYENIRFGPKSLIWMKNGEDSLTTIGIINGILADYKAQGYTLTLRQLYYQLVARGHTAENSIRAYKNLSVIVTKARNAGKISWTAIEDRGRNLNRYSFEEDSLEVVTGLEWLLSIDRWARQDHYLEVWVEKEALISVVERACGRLQVPHIACKGYLSASEAWRAGQRYREAIKAGKSCVMLHLGDHDPEGLDMTRDNEERLNKYSGYGGIEVKRLGLNMDQIEEYNPPPNYAKASSSRYENYVSQYGEECWELDALEPSVIEKLIKDNVNEYIDQDAWEDCGHLQAERRKPLAALADNWDEVCDLLEGHENNEYGYEE